MTDFGHEERVQESGVVGHSYDTDDRLEDLDIYEALVNPHDGQGGSQKRGGGGAPAMMPMGNTGASSKAETAAAGTTAAGAAKGTSAASAGAGKASGLTGTGGAGVGGAGYGSAGLGAGGLSGVGGTGSAGLGGLSSGLGSGGLGSGAGSSWTMPSYGTGAAGLPDPTVDQPGTGTGAIPPGGFTVPGTGTTPTVPGTSSGGIPPIKVPTVNTPGASGIKVPSAPGAGGGMPSAGGAGGGGGASASTANLGVKTVQASPEMLHKEAQYWDDTTKDFTANVANPVGNQSPSSVDFGMMTGAFSPYNDLLNRLKKWSTDAGSEFSAISDTLQSASGGYTDTEDTNTAASTRAATHSSIPV
jgi:hypothetical protein